MPNKKQKVDMSSDEIFEKAYFFYRKNENSRALVEIAKGDQNEARFIELKAQLLYRLERCDEALNLFNFLLSTHSDDFNETRLANIVSVYALIEGKKSKIEKELSTPVNIPFEPDSFEQMYNYACLLVNQSNFNDAIKLLDKASVKCRETLTEEGLKEEEILEELSVILAQKGYALQKLGLNEEALKIYKLIQDSKILDVNVMAVVYNNLQSIELPFFDRDKIFKAQSKLTKIFQKNRSKLTQLQKSVVKSNLEILKSTKLPAVGADAVGNKAFQEIVTGKLGKQRRKRKPRLPKNIDPNVMPDPERWLPRHERTAYKKKLNRKFKDRDIGRGTQGAASSAHFLNTANIDYSKNGCAPPFSVEQSPKPADGPRQQRPSAPKKTKKRKCGNKW